MSDFVPDGYCTMASARERTTIALFPAELSRASVTPLERSTLELHLNAERVREKRKAFGSRLQQIAVAQADNKSLSGGAPSSGYRTSNPSKRPQLVWAQAPADEKKILEELKGVDAEQLGKMTEKEFADYHAKFHVVDKVTPIFRGNDVTVAEIRSIQERINELAALHDRAWERLRQSLWAGHLAAYELDLNTGRIGPIPHFSWGKEPKSVFAVGVPARPRTTRRIRQLMKISELEAALSSTPPLSAQVPTRSDPPSQPTATEPPPLPEPPRNPRGAPPKHDAAKFTAIMAELTFEGFPDNQADLMSRALDVYCAELKGNDERAFPSASWAKPYVNQFWKRLKLQRRK